MFFFAYFLDSFDRLPFLGLILKHVLPMIVRFTYYSGLLRHQREVHRKNNDVKDLLMCPYDGCNRSTGNGFTRRANLRDHLCRRHTHTDKDGMTPTLMDITWEPSKELKGARINCPLATGLKRKQNSPNGELPHSDQNSDDLHRRG